MMQTESHVTLVRCRCGNSFEAMTTVDEVRVDFCPACHPALRQAQAEDRDQATPEPAFALSEAEN